MQFLNLVYLVLVILSLAVVYMSILKLGKSSLGTIYVYFFSSTLLLGMIRLFIYLVDMKSILIDDATMMVVWHSIFYLAVILLIISGRSLASLVDETLKKASLSTTLVTNITFVAIGALMIVFSPRIDTFVINNIKGTMLDMMGVFHFIAFALAGSASFYLFKIKQKYTGTLGVIAMPLFITLLFLGTIHLWELFTESWHIIAVTEDFGEMVESYLWVPVYSFLLYGFWKFVKKINA